jgi:hypothetical protein
VSLPNYDYPFFVIEHYRSHLANVRMHFGAFIEYSFSPSTQWTAIVSSATLKLPERSHLYLRPPGTKILLDPSTSARKAIVLVHSRLCIDLPHYDMDLVPWKWLSSIPHPQVASRERCAVTILKDTVSLTAHKEVHSVSTLPSKPRFVHVIIFLSRSASRAPHFFAENIIENPWFSVHWAHISRS